MHLVFVYGSLKKGFGNHGLLDGAEFVGEATTAPEFTMLHLGGFPGIVRGGETAISGEVYRVDDARLRRLDRLEGHPSFYERQPIPVTLGDGTAIETHGYVLGNGWADRCTSIPSGIWA